MKINLRSWSMAAVTTLASWQLAMGAVTLPHIFGDHTVLQAGQRVPVWGWATRGETVTVTFGEQTQKTTADAANGSWKVHLDPLKVSNRPAGLTVAGKDSVRFKDVLVGEVWLCSGQSNMQKPVGAWRGQPVTTINAAEEIAAANYPLIRMINVEIVNSDKPENDFDVSDRARIDYPWKG